MDKYELIDELVSIITKANPTQDEVNYFKQNYTNPELNANDLCYLFRKSVDNNKFLLADFIIEQGYVITDKIHEEFIEHFCNQYTDKLRYLLSKGYAINQNTIEIITSPTSYRANVDYFNSIVKPLLIAQKINKIRRNIDR